MHRAKAGTPLLHLLSWQCMFADGYARVLGEIRNLKKTNLENIHAIITVHDVAGRLIGSDVALTDVDPLPSGERSPFDTLVMANGLERSARCEIDFLDSAGAIRWIEG